MTRPGRPYAVDVAGRVPPNSEAAEAAVLSAILTEAATLDDVRASGLQPTHCYFGQHRDILAAAYATADEGRPVDLATVASTLQRQGRVQAIGGIAYLTKIVDATPAVANVVAHADIVRDLARRRAYLERLTFAQGKAWEHKGTTDELIADSMSELDDVIANGATTMVDAFDAVKQRWIELGEQWAGTRAPTGLPSHLPGLQETLGGYRLKGCSVVAGPTGGGKSSAALQEALGIAGTEHNGERIGVLVISLEMDAGENIDRALAIESGVPDRVIQSGAMTPKQSNDLGLAADVIARKPIWFESSEVDLHGIRAAWRKADREMQKHGDGRRVRLVLVDFLGLVRLDDAERHDIALTNLTRGLKMMAMAENIHVMELCQYNRGAQGMDPWAMPGLERLKDSSGVEQNANQVVMIHRVEGLDDYCALNVAKNRKGERGSVRARFDGACYRFLPPTADDVARWATARESGKGRRRRRV